MADLEVLDSTLDGIITHVEQLNLTTQLKQSYCITFKLNNLTYHVNSLHSK